MKAIKKVVAGFLLALGVPLSALAIADIVSQDATHEDKEGAIAALAIFTLPATIAGTSMLWGLYRDGRKHDRIAAQQERDRLQHLFYRIVREYDGRIGVLGFAMEAEITGEEAKLFLDEKAREFDASFEVREDGSIYYRFPL
ncbi:hypothetical protein [Oxynema aestuarii]|uniref:Uncharacterized protein n=1 Tax=Oxynema aestuarii AP17 TaxID=2064643 RepID=A0A6H1U103_9CYAN|nr:hypothetical protein [Oxynema aestuarii]QIZ72542.1 hypothetical protein HCG48_19715 [Oxynema aestuarii AP17]RMH78888.1 MAG: hypothetical protein D6680_00890 [Cyanobacteria bacterium J007]